MALSLTITRNSSLFNDADGDGQYDPGDVVLTKILISHAAASDLDALGVQVTATMNGLTPNGIVKVSPIALNDALPSISGNTPITITAAQLLGNDIDPDGAEANLTITGVSAANNGVIVNNGDGTFTFTPTTGYVGAASFQYTIADEQGLGSVTTGIVTFTVTDPIWYVNNATGSDVTGDGSYLKPFATFTPLNTGGSADALDNADDTIFVYNAGTYANASITLEAGQKLYGDGHAFSVNGLDIGANAANTTLSHTGVAVTLSSNNTIMGVTLNGTANGAIGIDDGGNNVGTLTIDETSILGFGKAIDIDQGGTLAVDIDQLSSNSSTSEGIHLQGVTGSFAAATGGIDASSGAGVLIGASGGATASSGGNVNFSYGGNINNSAGTSVEIQDRTGGTVSFNGQIGDTGLTAGQTGIVVDGSAGTVNFGQVNISAGATNGSGVAITNNSGTINFTGAGTGLDVNTTAGTGLTFTGGGTLNIGGAGNTVTTTTGQALNLQNGTMGTSGIAFQTITTGTVASGNAININNLDAAGAGTFSGGAVTIGGTAGAATDGINITASNSTFTFASATIDNTQGDGIEINGTSPNVTGAVTFTTVNIDGVGGAGINIVGATNAVNVNGGTIGATNDPTGDGVTITNGTGAVTIAADITKTSAGEAIDISGHSTGAIAISGDVTANGTSNGIRIVNNTSGNIDFTAASNVTLNTAGNAALTFTNNAATGANVTFAEGSLDIDTTSGTGINATSTTIGAGSLTISGGDNFVNATNGRAIFIEGVTTNITLEQVGVAGGGLNTGVYLKNTGSGGQFVVTGNASVQGSGGTIANIGGTDANGGAQGTGIYMENVSNVSLSNMIIGATGGGMDNFGIRGEMVNNFTLSDSEFRGTFGNNTSFDEGTIRFGTQNTSTGLYGTAVFQGNLIQGGLEDNLAVYLYGSNQLNMTVKDSTADAAVFGLNNTTTGNDSLFVENGGTSKLTLNVTGADFQGARGDQIQVLAKDSATQVVTLQNNNIHNTHSNIITGGGGVSLTGGGTNIDVTYTINGNSFKGARASEIFAMYNGNSGTIKGVITGNTFGTPNGVYDSSQANRGSMEGMAIYAGIDSKFANSGTLNYALRIDGNTIRDVNGSAAILLRSSTQDASGSGRLEATISNNTIAELGPNPTGGVYAQLGGADLTNDFGKMGLNISNNSFNGTGTLGFDGVVLDQGSANSRFYLPGYAGPANGITNQVSTYLQGKGNTFTNAAANNTGGAYVFANGVTGEAFTLAVPLLAAPVDSGNGWQDLAVSPVTAPPRDPDVVADSGTSGSSGGSDADTGTGTGTGGSTGGGETGTGGGSTPAPASGLITADDLGTMIEAAIQRWADAGATPDQIAAMRAVQFGVSDMTGVFVGASTNGLIVVDNDAAGRGWFVDATPGEDSEYEGSGTRLTADAGGAAEGKIDLLTVLMHELGHQIGLDDEYQSAATSDLMYGYVNAGERRLPASGEANGATPGSVGNTAYALAPVVVGTLPDDKAVEIHVYSTVNAVNPGYVTPFNNTAEVTATNPGFQPVTSANEQMIVDSLTLGGTVFNDVNEDGSLGVGDTRLAGVAVKLYVADGNAVFDGTETLVDTKTTDVNGNYSFSGLAEGNYFVVIAGSQFGAGQPLAGLKTLAGAADPDDNADGDDNGVASGSDVVSLPITLAYNTEPTPGTGNDTNTTLDLGFFAPNQAPVIGNLNGDTRAFVEGGSPILIDNLANLTVTDSDSANFDGGSLTIAITQNRASGEDFLGINTGGSVNTSTNTVSVNGTTIGTFSGGTGTDDLVFLFNANATPARVQTLLGNIVYGNTNAVDPSEAARTLTITLKDGDGTDGGAGNDTVSVTTTVTVAAVNDAPAGADNNDTTNDLTTLTFNPADFNTGFTDPESDGFAGVVITTLPLPADGELRLNNVAIAAGTFVTVDELTDGDLTFVPAANSAGHNPTFTFQVRDDGGTANGGQDTDQSANTFTIAITASNVAPVLDLDADDSVAAGSGFASSYTEGAAAAAIADTDSLITDSDVGDSVEGATVTIANAAAGDVLTVVGTLPGTITVDLVNSTSTKLVLIGTGTQAEYAAAIEQITFSTTSDDPTVGGTNVSRTVNVTVTDGDANSNVAVTTISVADDNADAPSGTNATITAAEDSFRLLTATDFGFTDSDGTLASVTITTVSGGSVYYDADGAGIGAREAQTTPVTFTAQDLADGKVSFMANPNANGLATGSIAFAVTDDDGNTDATPNTLTVDVTAVNDLPTKAGTETVTATEDTPLVIATATFSTGFGDVDGDSFASIKITTVPLLGQLLHDADGDAATAGVVVTDGYVISKADLDAGRLTYVPAQNANGTAYTSFQYAVGDSQGTYDATPNQVTVDVTATSDAPAFANLSGDGAVFTEGGGKVFLDTGSNVTITDIDNANFGGGKLRMTFNAQGTDAFGLDMSGPVTVDEDTFKVYVNDGADDVEVGTFVPVDLGNGQVGFDLVLTANATPALLQEVIRAAFYTNDSDAPITGVRTVNWSLLDGAGGATGTATSTVTVNASNDAPVLTDPTAPVITFTEGNGTIALMQGVVLSDVDLPANFAGGSITLSMTAGSVAGLALRSGSNFVVNSQGGGTFAIAYQDGNTQIALGDITGYGTANITISNLASTSATSLAVLNDLLNDFVMVNLSDNPSTADRTVTLTFDDGGNTGGTGLSDTVTQVIKTVAVNDAPTNSLGGTIGTSEDAVNAWLSGMSVSDPDADPANDIIYVTFQVLNGSIEIRTDVVGGITLADIVAQAVDTITVATTINKINATLAATNGLTYTPTPNFNGDDTLTVYTNDNGQNGTDPGLSGDGTSEEAVSTRTITVSAVPDAPIAQPDAVSTAENAVGTGNLLANNGSGPDSDADGDSITVSEVNGSAANVGVAITLASGAKLTVNADGTYSYDPNGKFNRLNDGSTGAVNTSATDTFSYTVAGGNTVIVTMTVNGVAGPGDRLEGDSADNTITGTPQGDFFFVVQGGDDDLSGLAGNDVFFFGGLLTSDDDVNGGLGTDQIALQGDYSGGLTFGADVIGIENLAILRGNDARFGDNAGNFYDYDLALLDENVAPGAQLTVDASGLRLGEDFTFDGSAEMDGSFFIYGGGGDDDLTGGAKNDVFLFGTAGQWGSGDVITGGGGIDQLALRGDYTITFGAGQLVAVEQIALLSAYDVRFGALGDRYDYNLTMNDGNVAGIQMTVDAAALRSDETLSFNGSAEDDGSFRVFGGMGNDVIQGSQNGDIIVGRDRGDTLYGNGGNDIFRYDFVSESNSTERDGIQDFNAGDLIDLSRIDADTLVAGNQAFDFIGGAAFSNKAGELRFENISLGGPIWLVQGDTDGNGVSDFEVVLVISPADPITSSDFIL
ncbi:MAG TPA: tandem-95 repeat protein [Allosphingosinicella sp.]|jgi:hypothetical protein